MLVQTAFTICFGVGVGYAVISFVLGLFSFIDIDMDFDIGDNDFDISIGGYVSFLKPSVICAFITVFGGVGLILLKPLGWFFAAMSGAGLGVVVAFIMWKYVFVWLKKMQNTSVSEQQSFIGLAAKVTEYIPQGKYGKITYYSNGNTYSAPAKSESGEGILRNTSVTIVYIKKNTYYVRPAIEVGVPEHSVAN
jgi:membrane protein implicated in regulation of membrane protease activity